MGDARCVTGLFDWRVDRCIKTPIHIRFSFWLGFGHFGRFAGDERLFRGALGGAGLENRLPQARLHGRA